MKRTIEFWREEIDPSTSFVQLSNPLETGGRLVCSAQVPFELNESGFAISFWAVPADHESGVVTQQPRGRLIKNAESPTDEIRGDNVVREVHFGEHELRPGERIACYGENESAVATKTMKATFAMREVEA